MFYFPNTVMKYLMLFQVVWNSETDFERFCCCTLCWIKIQNLPTRWVKNIHLFLSFVSKMSDGKAISIWRGLAAGLWWQV